MVDTPVSGATLIAVSSDNITGNYTIENLRQFIVSVRNVVPVAVTAAGTNQGSATPVTEHTNIITVCPSGAGVVVTGIYHKFVNPTAHDCLLYPPGTAQFWSSQSQANLSASAPDIIPAGGSAEVYMLNSSQGYVT